MKAKTAAEKQAIVQEFMQRAIVRATRRVMAENGYDGTSVELIAKEAGISPGTIYLYFHNKDDLLTGMIEQGVDSLISSVREKADGFSDPIDKIRAVLHEHARFFLQDPEFYKIYLIEKAKFIANPKVEWKERLREKYMVYVNYVEGLVALAVGQACLRTTDVRRTASLLLETAYSIVFHQMTRPPDTPLDEEVERFLDLILHGVRRPREDFTSRSG